jgi:hypothetical protein
MAKTTHNRRRVPKKRGVRKPAEKKGNALEGSPAVKRLFALLDKDRKRKWALFSAAVEEQRGGSPLQRAEGLLRFWAAHLAEWGDHEAVVYLVSRGADPKEYAGRILADWREAERDSVDRVVGTDTSLWAESVRRNPPSVVSSFWSSFDSQAFSIDATMLRTNEWCRLSGFESWWSEIANQIRQSAFSGSINPFFLFNMCRSELAVAEMRDVLALGLQSQEALSWDQRDPWWWPEPGCANQVAASFAFANARLGNVSNRKNLSEKAVYELRRHFDHRRGGWPSFSNRPENLSIETTAMALHALRSAEIGDWEYFAEPASRWLWDQQHVDGYWVERGAPDVVWLTVLVLDALELAAGGSNLTFGNGQRDSKAPLVFVAYQHGDSASLEELRKHLGALIHSNRIEFFSDRQIGGGEEWDTAILKRLNAAKIIVPLVSPNFLSSKYIQTVEFPTAIARHRSGDVTVLPVLLDACDWEALESDGFKLDRINLLPKDQNNNLKPLRQWRARKNEAFAQVAREIRNLVDSQSH